MINLLISSVIAGIVGTVLGAGIGILFGKRSEKLTSFLMCFAGGIMLAIVCFDLIPNAIDLSKEAFSGDNVFVEIFVVILSIGAGVCFVLLLSNIVIKKTITIDTNTNCDDMRRKRLITSGIVMTIAIALHNFPEGMAIGASQTLSAEKGALMAALLAIHNIPEGIAMVTPLTLGGMKKSKIIFVSALTGAPTVLGAVIGYIIGNGNLLLNSICVAIASGAMLYIIFNDMLREAMEVDKSNKPAIVTIGSIVLGIILINLLK